MRIYRTEYRDHVEIDGIEFSKEWKNTVARLTVRLAACAAFGYVIGRTGLLDKLVNKIESR